MKIYSLNKKGQSGSLLNLWKEENLQSRDFLGLNFFLENFVRRDYLIPVNCSCQKRVIRFAPPVAAIAPVAA